VYQTDNQKRRKTPNNFEPNPLPVLLEGDIIKGSKELAGNAEEWSQVPPACSHFFTGKVTG
jgi:hypothetical protein